MSVLITLLFGIQRQMSRSHYTQNLNKCLYSSQKLDFIRINLKLDVSHQMAVNYE
jgi:hypothetical protein